MRYRIIPGVESGFIIIHSHLGYYLEGGYYAKSLGAYYQGPPIQYFKTKQEAQFVLEEIKNEHT